MLKGSLGRLAANRSFGAAADGPGSGLTGLRSAGPPARRQGGRQVRGRGPLAFDPTAARTRAPVSEHWQAERGLATARSKAVEAEGRPYAPASPIMGAAGPARRARGLRRAGAFGEQDGAPPMRSVGKGSATSARWQHDQFDGPKTVGSAVFVRNLPQDVATAEHLAGVFAAAGQVASVQVDAGPLPTATIGFVRQDAALEAERRFHGRWMQGSQMKVSVKENSSLLVNGGDEDFWRQELKAMPKRPRQAAFGTGGRLDDLAPRKRVKGRGTVAFVAHDQRRVSIFDRLS